MRFCPFLQEHASADAKAFSFATEKAGKARAAPFLSESDGFSISNAATPVRIVVECGIRYMYVQHADILWLVVKA